MVEFTARDRLRLLLGGGALMLAACGGGEQSSPTGAFNGKPPPPGGDTGTGTGTGSGTSTNGDTPVTGLLRDTYRNNFKIGTAINHQQVDARNDSALIAADQFNSITPEWELKPSVINPSPGVYNFAEGDRIVDWALENGMDVRGHALLWHVSAPDHFLEGSREDIKLRLEDYIWRVMDHYRGRIHVWDVINEVVSPDIYRGADGVGPDRRSNWYSAVGNADYVDWAFHAARAADPNVQLFINEYDTETPLKRQWLVEILRRLRDRGVPIDGVGHQMHMFYDTDYREALAAIEAVDNEFMGLINHVTEIDVSVYHDPGSCWQTSTNCDSDYGPNPPYEVLKQQAELIENLMDGLTFKSSVESVSFWGVRDGDSWLNSSPIERHNHPLLFDRDGKAKPVFHAITDPNYQL